MQASAFTSVTARTTLASPQQNAPVKKVEWPDTVREYVRRAFDPANEIPGITRSEMETTLKRAITEATESGQLHSINWASYPLPQETIQRQRLQANFNQFIDGQGDIYSGFHSFPSNGGHKAFGHHDPSNKKRKSFEADLDAADTETATRGKNGGIGLEDRMTFTNKHTERLDKRQRKNGMHGNSEKGSSKFQADLEKRKQRFGIRTTGSPPSGDTLMRDTAPIPPDVPTGPVVGTSQQLEKRYLRLTAAPKPETVRPPQILRQTLDLLKRKWRDEGNYNYICDQFKSLRQDLFVQHVKNEFTVNVYELHARIALEKGDLGEYNQCQTQLRALYKQNLGGHPAEFHAYSIIYAIYASDRLDMNRILSTLTLEDKRQPAIKHALAVRSALALGNYHSFFRLYLDVPNMGGYLMDMFIKRERLAAMAVMSKVYRPDVKLRFLTEELAFSDDHECLDFLLESCGQQSFEERPNGPCFLTSKTAGLFESAKAAAFRKVDIKGQI